MTYLDEMVAGYVECAFWAGLDWSAMEDDNPRPLDENYGAEDLAPGAWDDIRAECADFLSYVAEAIGPDALDTWPRPADYVGHDFYLTRNGHGAGFWDRYTGGPLGSLGDALSDAAKTFGESDLYVGDDGKVHAP